MCVPSIAPIIPGKALAAVNPIIISSALLPSGHLINRGDNLAIAFDTRLTALNAVALPTLNFSQIDLYKYLNKYNLKIKRKTQYNNLEIKRKI